MPLNSVGLTECRSQSIHLLSNSSLNFFPPHEVCFLVFGGMDSSSSSVTRLRQIEMTESLVRFFFSHFLSQMKTISLEMAEMAAFLQSNKQENDANI